MLPAVANFNFWVLKISYAFQLQSAMDVVIFFPAFCLARKYSLLRFSLIRVGFWYTDDRDTALSGKPWETKLTRHYGVI
jgi:hypothetical protein